MNDNPFGIGLICLVDQSASAGLRGGGQAIKVFLSELKALWHERMNEMRVTALCEVALVSHQVQWLPAVPIYELDVGSFNISPDPGTALGQALRETGTHLSVLMESLMRLQNVLCLLRPMILLLSDGWSTDDPDEGLQVLKRTYWGQQAHLRSGVPPAMYNQRCERFLNAFSGNHIHSTVHMDVLLREMLQTLRQETTTKKIYQSFGGKL